MIADVSDFLSSWKSLSEERELHEVGKAAFDKHHKGEKLTHDEISAFGDFNPQRHAFVDMSMDQKWEKALTIVPVMRELVQEISGASRRAVEDSINSIFFGDSFQLMSMVANRDMIKAAVMQGPLFLCLDKTFGPPYSTWGSRIEVIEWLSGILSRQLDRLSFIIEGKPVYEIENNALRPLYGPTFCI